MWTLAPIISLFAATAGVQGFTTTHRIISSQSRPKSIGQWQQRQKINGQTVVLSSSPMTMRDRSSANWFQVGDAVKVVEDVSKAGTNLRGRQGIVVETWEKCDVDPTCCCAEEVDRGMAVHVRFQAATTTTQGQSSEEDSSFVHYFAEEELVKVPKQEINDLQTATENEGDGSPVPFDGMTCKAFKLQQLQVGKQAQRLAAFEATRRKESND